jgi:hypothetical protein
MLLKHVDFTAVGFGRKTVVLKDSCYACSKPLKATVGQLLYQPDYAGMDYEDGGQRARVQCKCGTGNYVTFMCTGEARFDSGKFHHHCSECADFGVCIGDYRNTHCGLCGTHYFAGLSGFACTGCGGKRRGVGVGEMAPPGGKCSTGGWREWRKRCWQRGRGSRKCWVSCWGMRRGAGRQLSGRCRD